jgi:hypothetical protein
MISDQLRSAVEEASGRLRAITDAEAAKRPSLHKWSKKEILGHLIDSASNNHQRFIRAQLEKRLSFPGYEQEGWNRTQRYQDAGWENLVDLWTAYNRHLCHVIRIIPTGRLSNTCVIGNGDPVTLDFLVEDYLRHLQHHLAQIFE